MAKGLVAHGVQPGDRVGIMSRTRWEWTLLDFACWAAGAVPVPLYETSSVDQVAWIASDADVHLVVVETATHADVVAEARADGRASSRGAVARRRRDRHARGRRRRRTGRGDRPALGADRGPTTSRR